LKFKAAGYGRCDFSGIVVLEAESYEYIFECFRSEEHREEVTPDEGNFADGIGIMFLSCRLATGN
jgi:hypothetical protein